MRLSPAFTRRLFRIAFWTGVAGCFLFALGVLALRHAVLPGIGERRADIEAMLSRAANLPLTIRAVDADWRGLHPRLTLRGLDIRDPEGRPALSFDRVDAELSWSSLWHFAPRLHHLEIEAPALSVRRDGAGRFFVAGLALDAPSTEGGFADWLLAQERITVRDATVTWDDAQRSAPTLALQRVNFDLRNSGRRHRFGLTADPPPALAARIDLRGDLVGRDIAALGDWKGEAYAELDYADLSAWRAWVDYPVELPRGSGGLRLWLNFDGREVAGLTADVRLADLDIRLGKGLPMLELARLEGRIGGKRTSGGYEVQAKKLALSTRGGVRVEPTDLRLQWAAAAAGREGRGSLVASRLDLSALAALAGRLPLDAATRGRLARFAPRGRIDGLDFAWTGAPEALRTWKLAARFEDLGLVAHDGLPGFEGLSGRADGNEQGGSVSLASRDAALEMPAVFAEPRLPLANLLAEAKWTAPASGGIDIRLVSARFENQDAAGEASGHYRMKGGGPGEIDLTAHLRRASGGAVWRYIPLTVGQGVRDWLRTSIVGGRGSDATLRLKGDLSRFPFRDGQGGLFEVKGRFEGATLRYADGWPEIRNLDGELLFEGARMLIRGERGAILGAALSGVTAEIPDLETFDEVISIAGKVSGPTAEFLRFIESSPVGARIDHFTEAMSASGSGDLALKLVMPLRRLGDTKVEGRYRFAGNRVVADPDLPPLERVNGELGFTGDGVEARQIRAEMLGSPMSLDVASAGGGRVMVKAAGTLAIGNLRAFADHRLLDHLSGSAPWQGTVSVRKKAAEVRIESSLKGISSSLPEPFNKTATEVLPLVFERRPVEGRGAADQVSVDLGAVFGLRLVRRHEPGKTVVERGAAAFGAQSLRLPERGLAVSIDLPRLDLDFWRGLAGNGGGTAGEGGLPLAQIDLRAGELRAFGRTFNQVKLSAAREGALWRADLLSREAAGKLDWSGEGAGRLSGRLSRVIVPGTANGKGIEAAEGANELPALDLAVDRFQLRGKELGELRLKAENHEGAWDARFDLRNEDGTIGGGGRWRPSRISPETSLNFKLKTPSVERLLVRLGYPDAIRRGKATLEGQLAWAGGPLSIDIPSLSGTLKLDAEKGQFAKLEPGAGRLLGVLSLQSLPRRLTLDFRDVFSEGFAFDGIEGEATIAGGLMETKNLLIAGPAAKVLMSGSVNLAAETQDMRVLVQPTIGDTVATGVLLAHPVTGAAAWAINKLLGGPLDRAFAFEYAVTGSWADPKVEKITSSQDGKRDAP